MTEWQTIDTAPKDGTPIEIQCNFGVKPWRGIFVYASPEMEGDTGWCRIHDKKSSIGYFALFSIRWRPFSGNISAYVDPFESIDAFDYTVLGRRPRRTFAQWIQRARPYERNALAKARGESA